MTIYNLHNRTGIAYALSYAATELKKGIGVKKRVTKSEHGGQSPLIHSHSTFNRYMGVAKEFVEYCKSNGANKIFKIDEAIVLAFFQDRKIAIGLTESTIKVNLCATEKFLGAIGRGELAEMLRSRYSEIYSQGTAPGRTEYFGDPKKVIDRLKNDYHRCIAKLQYLSGARIGDVKKIRTDMVGKQIFIAKSKGGRPRKLDFSEREEALRLVDQLCDELQGVHIPNLGWKQLRESYYKDLKQAVKASKEIYTGAHAFRANYAHERREQLIDSGISEKEADKIVSEELGHSRPSMGRYYSS